ncbi:MAG TPA: SMC family ATPase [Prolixibacteraceae bacterium]|nr:SMC family ATPase [Prolixibacteraceae bacterium]
MIPVKLTIEGLYSYQKKQSIDFTKLTASSLFGIFGNVGSGKSSILEAITYALYGDTTRLNKKESRGYNMMNLRSNNLLIDFEFKAGKNAQTYRCMVAGKRHKTKFEEVPSFERTAYEWKNENWSAIDVNKVPDIIGLSYDNFRRTIIIPQGQFQEFLQLGNTDRTRMLKELFKLERFELSPKVSVLEKSNTEKINHTKGQLEQLGTANADELPQWEAQLTALKTEIEQQTKELAEKQHIDTELKKLKELTDNLNNARIALKELIDKEPHFTDLEKQVKQYEACVLGFKNLIDNRKEKQEAIAKNEGERQKIEQQLKLSEETLTLLEKELQSIKPQYEQRDGLKQEADDLSIIVEVKDLGDKLKTNQQRLEKGKETVESKATEVKTIETERLKLDHNLKDLRAKLPDQLELSHAKTWHTNRQNIEKKLSEQGSELEKATTEASQLEMEINNKLISYKLQNLNAQSSLEEFTTSFSIFKDEIQQKIKQLTDDRTHLQVQLKLDDFAKQLHDGVACPLCGATEHPQVLKAENVNEALALIQQKAEAEQAKLKILETAQSELSIAFNNLKNKQEQLKALQNKKKETTTELANHQTLFAWSEAYKNAETVEKTLQESALSATQQKKLENELTNIQKKHETAQGELDRYKEAIRKIESESIEFQTKISTKKEQIKRLQFNNFANINKQTIEQRRNELLLTFSELEKKFNELNEQNQQTQNTLNKLKGKLDAIKNQLKTDRELLDKLQFQLDENLKASEFDTIETVLQILSQTINTVQANNEINEFRKQLNIRKSQVQNLKTELGERNYDADLHLNISTAIKELNEKITTNNQQVGKISEQIQKLQRDLEARKKLSDELEKLQLRGQNIATLKSMFNGSGFVNFVSSVYLQNLCEAANDRFFQLTRHNLSLEITADNNFQVRDFMNGGKVRNVKTLSGGQTFQASLSLALALSDNIQHATGTGQRFFFLDEGFGSLDKESLTIVFETLKTLHKENRIVGLISHVEEMQQEIDNYVKVNNTPEQGSIIQCSWEN